MTITPDNPKLDPISATLMALRQHDPVLGVMAEVRETFYEATRMLWDEGVSRYIKMRYDAIVDTNFGGDPGLASACMDANLANFDVAPTIHRACDVSDAPLMMEIAAYAMALAAINQQRAVWRTFETIIDHLYRQLPAKATT